MNQPYRVFAHYTHDVITGIVPLLVEFELRALLLARIGIDHVVFIGCTQPRESIRAQVKHLNACGLGPLWEHVHFGLAALPAGTQVEGFSGTSNELRGLADANQLLIVGPDPDQCWRANDKALMRLLCQADEQMQNYLAYGHVASPDELLSKVTEVMSRSGSVVVKDPTSGGGLNQVYLSSTDTTLHLADMNHCARYVVEERLFAGAEPGDVVDVSTQLYVTEQGTVEKISVTCQHIDHGHHCGNWGPASVSVSGKSAIPNSLADEVMNRAKRIVRAISQASGYWGPCSIDFLARLSTGEVYALDPNMRVTAPTYAIQASFNLFGEIRPFDMRSFAVPRGLSMERLLDHFGDLVFSREKEEGLILFCHVLDNFEAATEKQGGFCYGLVFARQPESLPALVDQVEIRKKQLLKKLNQQRQLAA